MLCKTAGFFNFLHYYPAGASGACIRVANEVPAIIIKTSLSLVYHIPSGVFSLVELLLIPYVD